MVRVCTARPYAPRCGARHRSFVQPAGRCPQGDGNVSVLSSSLPTLPRIPVIAVFALVRVFTSFPTSPPKAPFGTFSLSPKIEPNSITVDCLDVTDAAVAVALAGIV